MVTMLKNILGITVLISLLFPNFILAQIIADKNASIANQPSLLQTPNKAVQIDIVKPSKDGVSMNEYSKFNTLKTGTVLNNSKKGTNSITGGYIQANPQYNSDKKDTQTPKPTSTKSKIVAKEIINESLKIILNSIDLKIKDTLLNINSNLALKSINQLTSINSINNKNLDSIFINSFKNIDSDISIKTDYQTTSNKFISKKTSFNPLNFTLSTGSLGFIDKPIYEAKLHKELDSKNIQKASNLKAGKNI